MGEALLGHRLAQAGVDAHVHSAGLVSEGVPASANGVRAMARRGLDLDAHRSRPLTPALVAGADLVLGMAREHVREAVALDPDAFTRSFTLRELARRGARIGPRRPDEDLASWLQRAGAGRRATDLLGEHPDDDVADPIGRSRRTYERCAGDLETLVDQIATLAFPAGGLSRSYSA